jgi:hypothetical protein
MRGTGFVITEIILWLVAAALVGIVIGWLIRGWRSERKLSKRLESPLEEARSKAADLEGKLAAAETQRAEAKADSERLTARVEELEALQVGIHPADDPDPAGGDDDGSEEATVAPADDEDGEESAATATSTDP